MEKEAQKMTVMFLGDISLNDEYNDLYAKDLNPFQKVEPILDKADLVVGNLECFIRGKNGINPLRNYALSTNKQTMEYLKKLNLGLLGLANNHVYDNLDDGFTTTVNCLDQLNIRYFGASLTGDETAPFIFEHDGIRIGVLNYITRDTNPRKPESSRIKINWFVPEKVYNDIRELKAQTDHVVVYPHWGGVMEGSMYPEPKLFQIAHRLVDAGADLIIGHHSHTLQPFEVYKGKHIFYSLGNFCFSNVNKDGIISQIDSQRCRRSAILELAFTKTSYSVVIKGITNANNFIVPDDKSTVAAIRDFTSGGAWVKFPLTWSLYYFYEKNIYKIVRYYFAPGRDLFTQMRKVKPYMIKKSLINLLRSLKRSQ